MEQAEKSSAVITVPALDTFWGGYSGYFQDPDSHYGKWFGIQLGV